MLPFKNALGVKGDIPCGSAGEEFTCNVGDLGLIPGLGRPHGEENGYPLQFSFLEKSMEKQSEGLQPIGLQELEIT